MTLDLKVNFQGAYLKLLTILDFHPRYVIRLNHSEVNPYLDDIEHVFQILKRFKTYVQENIEFKYSLLYRSRKAETANHSSKIRLQAVKYNHYAARISVHLFDKSIWAQNLGFKSLCTISTWASNKLNLHWIEAVAFDHNIVSRTVFLSEGYDWVYDRLEKYRIRRKPAITKIYSVMFHNVNTGLLRET